MATVKQLIDELSFTHQLGTLVEVTQDTAVSRMQDIRAAVLATRAYMSNLIAVFEELRAAKTDEVTKLLEEKMRISSPQQRPAVGRESVTVLFTSSGKFAGGISQKVIDTFLSRLPELDSDIVIVGDKGKELLPKLQAARSVSYYDLNIDSPSMDQVDTLLGHLRQYASISVFTGRFENLVSQVPSAYNITGHEVLRAATGSAAQEKTRLQKAV